MIERRTFLLQLGAALAAGTGAAPARAGTLTPIFISAAMGSSDRDGAAVNAFDCDGRLLFTTRRPDRGHPQRRNVGYRVTHPLREQRG